MLGPGPDFGRDILRGTAEALQITILRKKIHRIH
jgi:hypothetical protein